MIDARAAVGTHDILFITLDTLRYDVACEAMALGQTPTLASLAPGGQWERRHSPGSFTYAAHQAFFAGFLPTPAEPGRHERLFALRFSGSQTTGARTAVFDAPDIVSGLAGRGYHTICIGGVGFFNKRTPLGSIAARPLRRKPLERADGRDRAALHPRAGPCRPGAGRRPAR